MPPFVPRKRSREWEREPSSPPPSSSRNNGEQAPKRPRTAEPASPNAKSLSPSTKDSREQKQPQHPVRPKRSVFDALEATPRLAAKAGDNEQFLRGRGLRGETDDESSGSESSMSFEDVVAPPADKNASFTAPDGETDSDEMEWEDALLPAMSTSLGTSADKDLPSNNITGDVEVKIRMGTGPDLSLRTKQGPSKREREIRTLTHQIHLVTLMWHNAIRNSWCSDKEVQRILVDGLSEGCVKEVERWRRAACLPPATITHTTDGAASAAKTAKSEKGKGKMGSSAGALERPAREWGSQATRVEPGVPDLSHGDPIIRLLKYLAAYWKKRFRITKPGLRKLGWMAPITLKERVEGWRASLGEIDSVSAEERKRGGKQENGVTRANTALEDIGNFGERVEDIESMREAAKRCEGSRDLGAQLFTALMRGLGIESRLVVSLQPVGFGWSKEEMAPVKKAAQGENPDDEPEDAKHQKKSRSRSGGGSHDPSAKKKNRKTIDLGDSSSELSDAPSSTSSNEAVAPKKKPKPPPTNSRAAERPDLDLPTPIYWTEVISPTAKSIIPTSPLILSTIANTPELLPTFMPPASVKSRQVMAYVVAFSENGSAKDVTVRYLRGKKWPGRTRGVRLPAEKVPIYGKTGKAVRWVEQDWFKALMRIWEQPDALKTEIDAKEDQDLRPSIDSKKPAEDANKIPDTLQGFKQSRKYVLERHLRREEALLPTAKPIATFDAGRGEKKSTEKVYLRKDVVACKTVESWHKEGRQLIVGAQPLKQVPVRAVTLTRKREVEEAKRESGTSLLQGLYAEHQTEWIVPDPIVDGKIPKNAFGNIDVYVESMIPKGAVHLRLKGAGRICKKLGIEYADACTGFEFGKQRAVPVIEGVVVAEENEGLMRDAWTAEVREKERKEDEKARKAVVGLWRKFLVGLRVKERFKVQYGYGTEEDDGEEKDSGRTERLGSAGAGEDTNSARELMPSRHEEDLPGGFLRDGHEDTAGGFVRDDETVTGERSPSGDHILPGGGFLTDDHLSASDPEPAAPTQAPISLSDLTKRILQTDTGDDTGSESECPSNRLESRSGTAPRNTSSRSRGRGRGRGRVHGRVLASQSARSTSLATAKRTERRRRVKQSSSDEESTQSSELSDLESPESEPDTDRESESENGVGDSALGSGSGSSEARMRGLEVARAARSAGVVRSRYFQSGSDVEGESRDGGKTERDETKPISRGMGRGRARGRRGRGRGRGRGSS